VSAPWEITPTDLVDDSVTVAEGSRNYRNRQYVQGNDVTDPQTETQVGDGDTRAWLMSYPLDQVPTVTVNGTPATVGIRGLETGRDFYWSRGENTISQDTGDPVLTGSDTLAVTYRGQFRILVMTEAPDAITATQEIEDGGSGIVEQLAAPDASITTRAAALEAGNAALLQFANIGRVVAFTTERIGLVAGQWAVIHLTPHGLDGVEMLLTSVELADVDDGLVWHVTATEGPDRASWARFFASAAPSLDSGTVDATVLILLTSYAERAGWAEDVAEHVYACPLPGVALYPSEVLYPC
jgi:hypothetical protein